MFGSLGGSVALMEYVGTLGANTSSAASKGNYLANHGELSLNCEAKRVDVAQ